MEISKFKKEDYNRPLSKASWDENKKLPLIDDDTRTAYKLDDLTKRICEELRDGQSSAGCDAYLEANGTHWFIEFKYQKSKAVDRKQIWRKAYDSICTVRMAINQTIALDDLCRNAVFLVVFQDEEQKGLDAFKQKTAGFAKEEYPVYWELRKIEGKLYREVHTIPATEFRAKWIPRIWAAENKEGIP